MSKGKRLTGLGKGLEALIPTTVEFTETGFKFRSSEPEESAGNQALLDVSKIRHNPYQPRRDFEVQALEELKNSILDHGVIQPVLVSRSVSGYELIAGERRLRASIDAGLTKIPAYILEDVTEIDKLELALIENLRREDLNPIEIANGYNRLIEECGITQEQVATKFGIDRTTVTNFLRLLKLPEKIQDSLRKKEITMGHARTLLVLSDLKNMSYLWQKVIETELSVRETERIARELQSGKISINEDLSSEKKGKGKKSEPKKILSDDVVTALNDHERRLRHIFGTQVKITPKNEESGSIEFDFYSKDDLDRLIDMFTTIELI